MAGHLSRHFREEEFDVGVVDDFEGGLHGGAGCELHAESQDVLVRDEIGCKFSLTLAGEVEAAQIAQTNGITLLEVFDDLCFEGTHGGFDVVPRDGTLLTDLVVEGVAFDGSLEYDAGVKVHLGGVLWIFSFYNV